MSSPSSLMDADCIHGVVWFDCAQCAAEDHNEADDHYEAVGGVEWCAVHQGIWDECAEHYTPDDVPVCDMWDHGSPTCVAVPLYLKSDSRFGDDEANDPVFDPAVALRQVRGG